MTTEKPSMFWSFNSDVCSAMNNNQFTIAAHSSSETAWGTANLDLNNDWLHGNEDPSTVTPDNPDGDPSQACIDVNNVQSQSDIDAIITNSNGNDDFVNDDWWSMDLIIQLQGDVGEYYDQDTDSSLQSSAVQQESSLIQSDMAEGTSTSDSEMQSMSSLIGNDASAITPQSDAGNSVTGVLGNSSTAQASISA